MRDIFLDIFPEVDYVAAVTTEMACRELKVLSILATDQYTGLHFCVNISTPETNLWPKFLLCDRNSPRILFILLKITVYS